jgi:MFS family permease
MPSNELEIQVRQSLRANVAFNLADGAFYGLGFGFGSIGTIITLFVSRMTSSALVIGLIPAIHAVGWQLPQLFMAEPVSRLRRYKPMVLWITTQERLPYLGLALVAAFMAPLGIRLTAVLTFLLIIWQGLGAGFTANAWQSMIAKIIPADSRGTFFGMQAALANVLMSVSAVAAGYILVKVRDPFNFSICFLCTAVGMGFSFICLSRTREPISQAGPPARAATSLTRGSMAILKRDKNFSAYVLVRVLSQFASMGFAFYILYGLQRFAMSDLTAGFLTASLTISSTVANAVMGWLGDRLGHRAMLIAGAFAITLSSLTAWAAPTIGWMYPAFILSGLGNVAIWTIGMAITAEFGSDQTRPTYFGLSNTLVAPFTFLAPLLGGWIADAAGFKTTFMLSALGGILTAVLLFALVHDPMPRRLAGAAGKRGPAAG